MNTEDHEYRKNDEGKLVEILPSKPREEIEHTREEIVRQIAECDASLSNLTGIRTYWANLLEKADTLEVEN